MDQTTIAFLKGITSFVVLAGTCLTTYWLRLRHRASRDNVQLQAEIERLNGELQELQRLLGVELPEVQERLDFVERRLGQIPASAHREEPEPTPV